MPLGRDELFRRLGYHRQGPGTAPFFELNRAIAMLTGRIWDQILPPGRETALAFTELEAALQRANQAVACNLDANLAELPELDVDVELDALLAFVEGPELTRTALDRCPGGAHCATHDPGNPHHRAGPDSIDVGTLEQRRELARLDADGTPEQTR